MYWCSNCEKFVETKDGKFVEHTMTRSGPRCKNSGKQAV